jgi:hypothetical protein
MKPHLSVLDLLSKALRRAVDPLFLDVDQMQRGRLRRLQDLRGKLTDPDTGFGTDRAVGHEFEHGHAVAEDTAILDVTVREITQPATSAAWICFDCYLFVVGALTA